MIEADDRSSALEATRAAVAGWLGVEGGAFDVTSNQGVVGQLR